MLETGRVVISLSGRDKDGMFIITSVGEDGLCRIADGRAHMLGAPKKKNPKHLRATAHILAPEQYLTDRGLRRTLRELSE